MRENVFCFWVDSVLSIYRFLDFLNLKTLYIKDISYYLSTLNFHLLFSVTTTSVAFTSDTSESKVWSSMMQVTNEEVRD